MSSTLYNANRMYAQISLLSKIYLIYIVHIYNTICRIITVDMYSAQNVLKDKIQVRNSDMPGKSDVIGVRE